MLTNIDTLLTREKVEQLTGLSRSSIYRLMSLGKFPTPLKVGFSAVRWKESEIRDWQDGLKKRSISKFVE